MDLRPASKRLPAAKNMSVFADPQSSVDVALSASAEVREDVEATVGNAPGVAEAMLPGAVRPRTFRALMTDVGRERRSIWALVTRKGRVCAGLTGHSSGCISKFTSPEEHASVTATVSSAGEMLMVWGLVPDDVARVDVVVAGLLREARLGRNAFYYALASAEIEAKGIEGLVLTLKDDRQIEIPFGPTAPAPSLD